MDRSFQDSRPRSWQKLHRPYVDRTSLFEEQSATSHAWDPTTSEVELSSALKEGEIQDDIAMRAGTYDSHVTRAKRISVEASGNRIEIARALVCRPSIIVLDEATAVARPNHGKGPSTIICAAVAAPASHRRIVSARSGTATRSSSCGRKGH